MPPGLNTPFRVDVKGEELAARTAGESTRSLPGQLARALLPSRARLLRSRIACTQALYASTQQQGSRACSGSFRPQEQSPVRGCQRPDDLHLHSPVLAASNGAPAQACPWSQIPPPRAPG